MFMVAYLLRLIRRSFGGVLLKFCWCYFSGGVKGVGLGKANERSNYEAEAGGSLLFFLSLSVESGVGIVG